jgi:hypothetical protein
MLLQTLNTLAQGKAFEYKYADSEELVVYPSDSDGQPQKKHAYIVTRFEQEIVRDRIRQAGTITVGASRDNPPAGSLGAALKAQGCSPQVLSYLSAVLVFEQFCTEARQGNSIALRVNRVATS